VKFAQKVYMKKIDLLLICDIMALVRGNTITVIAKLTDFAR